MAEEQKDIAPAIKDIASAKSKDSFTQLTEATEGSFVGAAIGLTAGLAMGYLKKYNLFYSAVIGMFAGGVIASFFIKRK